MHAATVTRHRHVWPQALLVVALAASFALVTGVAPAAARSSAQPCWKRVLHDWFLDGRIDGTYPPKCLNEAMGHLPPDAKQYSNFQDEAKRALQADERWQRDHPHRKAHYTYGLAIQGGGGGGGPDGTGHGPNWGPGSLHPGQAAEAAGNGPFAALFDRTQPSDPSSVPVPLLVLGGIGVLLLLAAAASLVARRIQARRPAPAPAPATAPGEPKRR